MNVRRRTVRYTLGSFGPPAAVAAIFEWRLGSAGLLVAALLGLPWLAWRYDNETGALLPLAVLFLFALAVLGLLLFLMEITFFAAH